MRGRARSKQRRAERSRHALLMSRGLSNDIIDDDSGESPADADGSARGSRREPPAIEWLTDSPVRIPISRQPNAVRSKVRHSGMALRAVRARRKVRHRSRGTPAKRGIANVDA